MTSPGPPAIGGAAIELVGVGKDYAGKPVIDALDLSFAAGSLTVLIGPSGCGKSTTLRIINQLIVPDRGRVLIGGQDAASLPGPVLRRRIGYAIQAVGLFPHWNVARNIGAVPALLGWTPARIRARVLELLTLLGLPPDEYAGAMPSRLSGGQAQRVGVARALAADPEIVLMDEPFGALDPPTRAALQIEVRRIQRSSGKTLVFVTHDIDEALLLADRIVLMQGGRVAQAGTPIELLDAPASDFVRDFVGGEQPGLRRLSLVLIQERVRPGQDGGPVAIDAGASLREALSVMLGAGCDRLTVMQSGQAMGALHFVDLCV